MDAPQDFIKINKSAIKNKATSHLVNNAFYIYFKSLIYQRIHKLNIIKDYMNFIN